MKNNTTKIILGLTTLGVAGATLVSAQTLTGNFTPTSQSNTGFMQNLTDAQKAILEQAKTLFESGKKTEAKTLLDQNGLKVPQKGRGHGEKGGMADRKAIEAAIIAGNYTTFQTLASTTPLKSITQETFNSLTPQFAAKKAAEDRIQAILKAAGIEQPTPGQKPTKSSAVSP